VTYFKDMSRMPRCLLQCLSRPVFGDSHIGHFFRRSYSAERMSAVGTKQIHSISAVMLQLSMAESIHQGTCAKRFFWPMIVWCEVRSGGE
jgi:hypothetical protein